MIAIGILLNISKGEEWANMVNNREVLVRRKARRNVYRRYNSVSG
jgi:hypothetical protein